MVSPGTQSGSLATFSVKINGTAIPTELNVFSISIHQTVNRISSATLVILDGNPETGTFEASSSSLFVPGASISIAGGYDGRNVVIFEGIVTGQRIRIDPATGSLLEIECRDTAVKMTQGRKSLSFSNAKDSDIISSVIGSYSGIAAAVTATDIVRPLQAQYYVTDWDFILSLAEANGLIVTTLNNKVSVFAPDANTSPVLSVTYGVDMIAFDADLDSINQLSDVKATAWDYSNQSAVTEAVGNSYAGPGNLSPKTLSKVADLSAYELETAAALTPAELTEWGKAELVKHNFSKIQGTVKFQGSSLARPGKYITLAGLGDRFNGDHLISGVTQDFSEGNWITEVAFGLSATWFTEERDIAAPSASGLLPGVKGLLQGTVKQTSADPDGQYRILVTIPMLDITGNGVWARLANFYATSGAGAFFLPEVGDEVVLGFFNEDPRYPVILGSMYSSANIKPQAGLEPNEKNSIKAIVTKTGMSIRFDEENDIITVNTPGNNSITLSDKDKTLKLGDQNGNSIVMSSSGITIKSAGNIALEADQNISIKGDTGIKIQSAGGDVSVSGMNIKETAQMQYSAEGSMSAKVQAGMELTLKGAMIMIN